MFRVWVHEYKVLASWVETPTKCIGSGRSAGALRGFISC